MAICFSMIVVMIKKTPLYKPPKEQGKPGAFVRYVWDQNLGVSRGIDVYRTQ